MVACIHEGVRAQCFESVIMLPCLFSRCCIAFLHDSGGYPPPLPDCLPGATHRLSVKKSSCKNYQSHYPHAYARNTRTLLVCNANNSDVRQEVLLWKSA